MSLVSEWWRATMPGAAVRVIRPKIDRCTRCGWLLADKPGRVAGLCSLCCEDMTRGVIYRGESKEDYVRWGEMVVRP